MQRYNIPRVSTIGNFLTIAFLFAMRITPIASVTVTTIGRPSGIAATARLHHSTYATTAQTQALVVVVVAVVVIVVVVVVSYILA